MTARVAVSLVLLLLVGFLVRDALHRKGAMAASAPVGPDHIFGSEDSDVPFRIAPAAQSPAGMAAWDATYAAEGHAARFRFALSIPKPQDKSASSNVTFGKGLFESLPDSDSASLLPALKKALQAKEMPGMINRATSLPFTYAILGSQQSRSPGGGFNSKPAGTWLAMKIFIETPEGDADEFYLNMSLPTGQAEFSIKDPDYGDNLLKQLATVL